MCPTTATNPAAAGALASPLSRMASATLAAPLAISRRATSTPALTPETRSALAAPMLPLPTRRRSSAPHRRASSSANGTDPMKYARTRIKAIPRTRISDFRAPRPLGSFQHQAQHVEGGLCGLKLDHLAGADKLKSSHVRIGADEDRNHHGSDRLIRRAASWAGDARDSDADVS